MTSLAHLIATIPIGDTHEHLEPPCVYVDYARDAMSALFGMHAYIGHDLISSGCNQQDVQFATDNTNEDIVERWARISGAWEQCQYTSYAEGVKLAAKAVYNIDHISADTLISAQKRHDALRSVEGHKRLLAQMAGLKHVQIDAFTWSRPDNAGDADFYHYDINVCTLAAGTVELNKLAEDSGVTIHDLTSYRTAIASLIASNAKNAVAIKSQHAYNRTLAWERRDDLSAEMVLNKKLNGVELNVDERLCLGDWSLDQIAVHAAKHSLPVKIHTGHYAGNNWMPIDFVRPGQMCSLFSAHTSTKFVLMHIAYPYQNELLSIAKHYQNVVVDLCWAWSINPLATMQFVSDWIHSVPINKLLGFGGDAFLPAQAVGFALQSRKWLTRTLQREIDECFLKELDAMNIARKLLFDNQDELFYQSRASSM